MRPEPLGNTPTNAGQASQGQYVGQPGDTLGKIALDLARQFGMPVATQQERNTSAQAVLQDLYRLNPSLKVEGAVPQAARAQLPISGQTINLPTVKPQTTPVDQVESQPAGTTERTPTDPLSPDAVNQERQRTDATAGAEGPEQANEEEPSGFEKVFGPIRKLFKNPVFQGLMAVLNLIPGLNVVVSGLCAIIGLTNIVTKIAQGKGMDVLKNPLELGSTLGYIAGVFMPGLGAMGGLMGMLQFLKESGSGENQEEQPAARRRQRTDRANPNQGTQRTPASEQIPAEQRTARVRAASDQLPHVLNDDAQFLEWLGEVGKLRQEYDRLIAPARDVPAEGRAAAIEQIAADNPGFRELTEFFNGQLPSAVAAQAGDLAFGLSDLRPTDTPQPGRLYEMPRDMSIAELAATAGGGRTEQMAAAIAAHNATRADAMVKQGDLLYVPQLAATDRQWPTTMPMTSDDPAGVKARLLELRRELSHLSSKEARHAMQLIDILEQMATRPAPMPDRSVGAQLPA